MGRTMSSKKKEKDASPNVAQGVEDSELASKAHKLRRGKLEDSDHRNNR